MLKVFSVVNTWEEHLGEYGGYACGTMYGSYIPCK